MLRLLRPRIVCEKLAWGRLSVEGIVQGISLGRLFDETMVVQNAAERRRRHGGNARLRGCRRGCLVRADELPLVRISRAVAARSLRLVDRNLLLRWDLLRLRGRLRQLGLGGLQGLLASDPLGRESLCISLEGLVFLHGVPDRLQPLLSSHLANDPGAAAILAREEVHPSDARLIEYVQPVVQFVLHIDQQQQLLRLELLIILTQEQAHMLRVHQHEVEHIPAHVLRQIRVQLGRGPQRLPRPVVAERHGLEPGVGAEVPHLDLAALGGAVLDVAPLVDGLLPAVLAAREVDGEGAAREQVDLEDAVRGEIGRLGGGVGRAVFLEVTDDDGALADLEARFLDALADGWRSISGDVRE